MIKVLIFLLIVLWNADVALSVEFKFNEQIYQRWGVSNYNEVLRVEIKRDNRTSQEYLRITREDYVPGDLAQGKRIDTAFKLLPPLLKVVPNKVYYLKIKKRCSFDIPYVEINKEWNHIIWYDMYGEEIGKTFLNGMGGKSDSVDFFVDTGLFALPEAEKARIVLGFDRPDFSEKDFASFLPDRDEYFITNTCPKCSSLGFCKPNHIIFSRFKNANQKLTRRNVIIGTRHISAKYPSTSIAIIKSTNAIPRATPFYRQVTLLKFCTT